MPEVDLYGVLTPFVCPPPPSRTKRAGGGFYYVSTTFVHPPPPSHAKTRRRWFLLHFDAVCASSTSLACKSKPEVDLYGVSTPFSHLPPPSHANASRRWFCRVSTLLGQAGGHFDTVRTSSTSLACKSGQGGSLITF
ncbi:hypothetical protein BDZ97DRAFT_96757 [Flammula alnicola]|nr:hypothetical protein BDZ97DRAFT_96757 [Flammula alnicola]